MWTCNKEDMYEQSINQIQTSLAQYNLIYHIALFTIEVPIPRNKVKSEIYLH